MSIKSRTLKRSCKFHAELHVTVAKFIVTEIRAIQWSHGSWFGTFRANCYKWIPKLLSLEPRCDSIVTIYCKCTKPTQCTEWRELLSQRISQLSHEVQCEIYNFVSKFAIWLTTTQLLLSSLRTARISNKLRKPFVKIFVKRTVIIMVQLYYWLSNNPSVKIWSNKFQIVMINYSKLCASL